jgi:hypothetical protein
MGTQVLAAADHNTKPNYVVSTVAAGSVVVADGEFALFVGANATVQLNAFNGAVAHCRQALREAGWQNPTTGVVVEAIYDVITQQSTDTITEDTVALIQGFDFTKVGDSNSAHGKAMMELYLEDVAKAA